MWRAARAVLGVLVVSAAFGAGAWISYDEGQGPTAMLLTGFMAGGLAWLIVREDPPPRG